jgi:hypothetical protein
MFLDKDFVFPNYLEGMLFDAALKELTSTYKAIPEHSHEINKNDNQLK